jgi:hypothetical protein
MQDFFKIQEGQEERVYQVAYASCKRRVTDLHYESRLQAHIDYNAKFLLRRVNKEEARRMTLTREQYIQVNTKHEYSFLLRLSMPNLIF